MTILSVLLLLRNRRQNRARVNEWMKTEQAEILIEICLFIYSSRTSITFTHLSHCRSFWQTSRIYSRNIYIAMFHITFTSSKKYLGVPWCRRTASSEAWPEGPAERTQTTKKREYFGENSWEHSEFFIKNLNYHFNQRESPPRLKRHCRFFRKIFHFECLRWRRLHINTSISKSMGVQHKSRHQIVLCRTEKQQ